MTELALDAGARTDVVAHVSESVQSLPGLGLLQILLNLLCCLSF